MDSEAPPPRVVIICRTLFLNSIRLPLLRTPVKSSIYPHASVNESEV